MTRGVMLSLSLLRFCLLKSRYASFSFILMYTQTQTHIQIHDLATHLVSIVKFCLMIWILKSALKPMLQILEQKLFRSYSHVRLWFCFVLFMGFSSRLYVIFVSIDRFYTIDYHASEREIQGERERETQNKMNITSLYVMC